MESAKPAPTPSAAKAGEETDEEPLSGEEATKFRSHVGSLAYFCMDRQDVQYEVNQLARK